MIPISKCAIHTFKQLSPFLHVYIWTAIPLYITMQSFNVSQQPPIASRFRLYFAINTSLLSYIRFA